ncbi:hypothetical protein C6A87_021195 [Mycobacterium sp. ITM-2016-00317]|uniref:hypothetical protein n=1 Tax=Mycobacterium sp. ITM-2016-00317 TaxID=2099694 RepID=UPI00287F77CF|nr:hypothetical protein [Mycobacterium sp. ITM-2016-00317]WNG86352.1 hypothetical protein C6A87_021195 [Mycobacterium sp. ITM-2016-00317]
MVKMRRYISISNTAHLWRSAFFAAMAVACAVGVTSCSADGNLATAELRDEHSVEASDTNRPEAIVGTTAASPSVAVGGVDELQRSFEAVSSDIAGDVGVAIASANGVRSFGSWRTGPAWSTIKVPLAIAALRNSQEAAAPFVDPAIRSSDNAAAEALWAQLGQPEEAAASVGAVLVEAGDSSTIVESERRRSEFTAFGQTDWSLANQATFASKLRCLSRSDSVINDMGDVAGNQQWGLAGKNHAAVKGGWGPSPEGPYLVRQIALVETESGSVGIALAAQASDGGFQTGSTQLDTLSAWVLDHLGFFPGAHC